MQTSVPDVVVLIIELVYIGPEQILDHVDILRSAARIFQQQKDKVMMVWEMDDFILPHLQQLCTIKMSLQNSQFPRVEIFLIGNLIDQLTQVYH